MIPLASLIEQFEPAFLTQYGDRLQPEQRQALTAMKACRTALSPKRQARCPACEEQLCVPHSCGHRLRPHCQHHERQQWLERQLKTLVPGQYFLVTFTVPAEFRPLALTEPRSVFDWLIQCAWQTLLSCSRNDRQRQGTPGAVAVLHTHSRRLAFHPHGHCVAPAAALDTEKRLWRTKAGKRYLFNHKALAKVFRAQLLPGLTALGVNLPPCHPTRWIVDCKPVGSGQKALV
jgi:hypothetical protein